MDGEHGRNLSVSEGEGREQVNDCSHKGGDGLLSLSPPPSLSPSLPPLLAVSPPSSSPSAVGYPGVQSEPSGTSMDRMIWSTGMVSGTGRKNAANDEDGEGDELLLLKIIDDYGGELRGGELATVVLGGPVGGGAEGPAVPIARQPRGNSCGAEDGGGGMFVAPDAALDLLIGALRAGKRHKTPPSFGDVPVRRSWTFPPTGVGSEEARREARAWGSALNDVLMSARDDDGADTARVAAAPPKLYSHMPWLAGPPHDLLEVYSITQNAMNHRLGLQSAAAAGTSAACLCVGSHRARLA